MMSMYQITICLLVVALVLLGWSCCRLLPRLPGSGGVCGLRFWLALLLVVAFDRTLNDVYFVISAGMYDDADAARAFIEAIVLFVLTRVQLKSVATAVIASDSTA